MQTLYIDRRDTRIDVDRERILGSVENYRELITLAHN